MSTHITFNPDEMLQIVAPDGSCHESLDPDLDATALRRLYRGMLLTRTVDIRGMILQRQGRIGFYVPSTGEEASQVGSAFALGPSDWIVAAYREPGAAYLRGLSVGSFFHQTAGSGKDLLKGRQMPSHFGAKSANFVPASSPVGTQIPIATGVAWAAKIRKDPMVTLVYFGDGSTSQGDFHTGLNFAGVYRVPIVFFCKNNQWAISCPFAKQTASGCVAVKALSYGFEGVRVDGNDILAVYVATKRAVDNARAGEGPTLIESFTYRVGPHSTSDDPRRYRDDAEVARWREKDPILRYRNYLERKGLWSAEDQESLQAELDQEVDDAIESALASPPPDMETLFTDVYEIPTWNLREQLEQAMQKVGQ